MNRYMDRYVVCDFCKNEFKITETVYIESRDKKKLNCFCDGCVKSARILNNNYRFNNNDKLQV